MSLPDHRCALDPQHEPHRSSLPQIALAWLVFLLPTSSVWAQSDIPRFDLGGQFTFVRYISKVSVTSQQGGFGTSFSWNAKRYFSLDASFNYLPDHKGSFTLIDSYQGGSLLQAFFGVKVGLRKKRFGLFGRARPGLVSFSKTVTTASVMPLTLATNRLTEPAADFGLTAEYYVSRQVALRYDVGDTAFFYRRRDIPVPGSANEILPALTSNAFQLSIGIVLRF